MTKIAVSANDHGEVVVSTGRMTTLIREGGGGDGLTNFVLAVIVTVGICPVDDRNSWTGIAHHLVVL